MAIYRYNARDKQGKVAQGIQIADSVSELREALRNSDLYLTKYTIQGGTSSETKKLSELQIGPAKKPKLGDMVVMSRQFATLVRAGLNITEALHTIAAQTPQPMLADALRQVRADVVAGSSLAESMRKHPKVFNELYVALVEAGEAGGTLDQTLETAADQFDRDAELREQVKSALTYPTLVLVASAGVVAFMLVFIVPSFKKVYDQFNAKLPPITQVLVWLSDLIVHRSWIVVTVMVAGGYAFKKYIDTPAGRLFFDGLKLKLPLFGPLMRKIAVARFTQTWAGLQRGGLQILRALDVSSKTSGNVVIRNSIMAAQEQIKEGANLSGVIDSTGQFPPMVIQMVAAGEQSGNLDEMLEEIARFYRRDIDYSVQKMTRLIEPLMTMVVGGIVLFILLALYMPVFNLTNVMRK